MIKLYDRKAKTLVEEKVYGKQKLEFLYNNPFGRVLLRVAYGHFCANLCALYNKSFLSKNKIEISIRSQFRSFADFFKRKEQRDFVEDGSVLISPADSKVLCYQIDDDKLLKIKNTTYSVPDLVGFKLSGYEDGTCLIFRLSIDDYHRYCFIDSGRLIESQHIKGKLHTVSSISEKYPVFIQNDRIVNRLMTDNFGEIIQIEIGAMLVGRIHNLHKKTFQKGEEKGYFELGGSTIVILLKKGVKIDDDIVAQSKKNIETIVHYGERIGEK